LDRNYDDCLHLVQGDSLYKLVPFLKANVLLKITENGADLSVEVVNEGDVSEDEIISFVKDWLDLESDLESFYALSEKNHILKKLTENFYGLRLPAISNLYEALVWSITGQQINLPFAYTLKRRLVEAFGDQYTWQGINFYCFPRPEQVLTWTVEDFQKMQFSKQKAQYILNVSQEFVEEKLSKEQLLHLPDTKAMLDRLCQIKGVGEWTANYALMKSLKRPDCVLYSDVGLIKAFQTQMNLESKPSRKILEDFFNQIPNYESYTVLYLWRSLIERLK